MKTTQVLDGLLATSNTAHDILRSNELNFSDPQINLIVDYFLRLENETLAFYLELLFELYNSAEAAPADGVDITSKAELAESRIISHFKSLVEAHLKGNLTFQTQ